MTKCMRCDRTLEAAAHREDWNAVFVNGKVQGFLCPVCQSPEEAEEAVHNLPKDKATTWVHALDARWVENDDFREYLEKLPEDGSVVAPAVGFANLADSSIGFQVGFIPAGKVETIDHDTILSCWFPCLSEPDSQTVMGPEDVPTFVMDRLQLGPEPVFMECPIPDWMGWRQVIVVGEKAKEVQEAMGKLFKHYIATVS